MKQTIFFLSVLCLCSCGTPDSSSDAHDLSSDESCRADPKCTWNAFLDALDSEGCTEAISFTCPDESDVLEYLCDEKNFLRSLTGWKISEEALGWRNSKVERWMEVRMTNPDPAAVNPFTGEAKKVPIGFILVEGKWYIGFGERTCMYGW